MDNAENTSLSSEFVSWVLAQRIDGCRIEATEGGLRLLSKAATGEVNIYNIDGQQIVDMRLVQPSDGETIFFLHFELEDLARAKVIFNEMREALVGLINHEVRHVLLCCTCGITTTYFANKLNETARTLGLDYDFRALPIEEAIEHGNEYVAVLLAPQVGHRARELSGRLANTVVLELPGRIFGAYDAAGALRLVIDAIAECEQASNVVAHDMLDAVRERSKDARVLSISHVMREKRESTLCYGIFDHGKTTLSGKKTRRHLGLDSIVELVEAIRDSGWDIAEFDAIGIAVSYRVKDGVIYVDDESGETQTIPFAQELSERWGASVFVYYAGLAAATGCYLTQASYKTVAFYAQPLGNPRPTQGFVIDGVPYEGKAGLAGHMGHVLYGLSLSRDFVASSWHYAGVRELATRYVGNIACTIAPEAVYVWCDLMPSLEDLEASLCKVLPADAVPDLIAVSDYEGCVITGAYGLCLLRLVLRDED